MNIQILGRAPNRIGGRMQFGFIVETSQNNILLDCGPGIYNSVYNKMSPKDVDLIFISHKHADHTAGVQEYVNNYMFKSYYNHEDVGNHLEIMIPEENSRLERDCREDYGWMMMPDAENRLSITNRHSSFETFAVPHSVETHGVVIENGGKKVVYLPDCLEITREIVRVTDGADAVIVAVGGSDARSKELAQFGFGTSKMVGDLCKQSRIKYLIPFHIFHEGDEKIVQKELQMYCPDTQCVWGEQVTV